LAILLLLCLLFPLRAVLTSPDSPLYAAHALNLHLGLGYVEADQITPVLHRAPLFAGLLARLLGWSGSLEVAAWLLIRASFVMAVLLCYAVARAWVGTGAALLASFLALSCPVLNDYGSQLLLDIVFAVPALAALHWTKGALDGGGLTRALAAGVALGLAFWIKELALLLVPFPVLWMLLAGRLRDARAWGLCLVVGAAALAVVLPWIVYVRGHGGAWVSLLGLNALEVGRSLASGHGDGGVLQRAASWAGHLGSFFQRYMVGELPLWPLVAAAWAHAAGRGLWRRGSPERTLLCCLVLFLPAMLFLGDRGYRPGQVLVLYLLSYVAAAGFLVRVLGAARTACGTGTLGAGGLRRAGIMGLILVVCAAVLGIQVRKTWALWDQRVGSWQGPGPEFTGAMNPHDRRAAREILGHLAPGTPALCPWQSLNALYVYGRGAYPLIHLGLRGASTQVRVNEIRAGGPPEAPGRWTALMGSHTGGKVTLMAVSDGDLQEARARSGAAHLLIPPRYGELTEILEGDEAYSLMAASPFLGAARGRGARPRLALYELRVPKASGSAHRLVACESLLVSLDRLAADHPRQFHAVASSFFGGVPGVARGELAWLEPGAWFGDPQVLKGIWRSLLAGDAPGGAREGRLAPGMVRVQRFSDGLECWAHAPGRVRPTKGETWVTYWRNPMVEKGSYAVQLVWSGQGGGRAGEALRLDVDASSPWRVLRVPWSPPRELARGVYQVGWRARRWSGVDSRTVPVPPSGPEFPGEVVHDAPVPLAGALAPVPGVRIYRELYPGIVLLGADVARLETGLRRWVDLVLYYQVTKRPDAEDQWGCELGGEWGWNAARLMARWRLEAGPGGAQGVLGLPEGWGPPRWLPGDRIVERYQVPAGEGEGGPSNRGTHLRFTGTAGGAPLSCMVPLAAEESAPGCGGEPGTALLFAVEAPGNAAANGDDVGAWEILHGAGLAGMVVQGPRVLAQALPRGIPSSAVASGVREGLEGSQAAVAAGGRDGSGAWWVRRVRPVEHPFPDGAPYRVRLEHSDPSVSWGVADLRAWGLDLPGVPAPRAALFSPDGRRMEGPIALGPWCFLVRLAETGSYALYYGADGGTMAAGTRREWVRRGPGMWRRLMGLGELEGGIRSFALERASGPAGAAPPGGGAHYRLTLHVPSPTPKAMVKRAVDVPLERPRRMGPESFLVYSVMFPEDPGISPSVQLGFEDGDTSRHNPALDLQGAPAAWHNPARSYALGRWWTRVVPMGAYAGRDAVCFYLMMHQNGTAIPAGEHVFYFDQPRVEDGKIGRLPVGGMDVSLPAWARQFAPP
jgi:4-amino-4-deoxy-L-arabinose transferase-like glycosyltransferase